MTSRVFLAVAGTTLLAASAVRADTWRLDPAHSSAQFSVRHMGISTVRGAFTKVTGAVDYDPANLNKSSVDVTIQADSVDTRVEMRDKDLRGSNFLDVEKYPTITFKSKRVEADGSKMKVIGDLTIHGVTKEVVLDVDGPTPPMKDQRGNMHMGASATTKISRKEFGVVGFPAVVGDDLNITIDVEMVKRAEEAH